MTAAQIVFPVSAANRVPNTDEVTPMAEMICKIDQIIKHTNFLALKERTTYNLTNTTIIQPSPRGGNKTSSPRGPGSC